jgi:fibronectin type 3 domain-containing protein
VPCGSLSAYQNDVNWNYFQQILKPVPRIVSVREDINSIIVTCSGVTNTYEVYRNNDDNPVYTVTNAGNEFSFVDNDVIIGTSYCYRVRTIDNDCQDDFSEPVCIVVTNMSETAQTAITVYPNPAIDELTIDNSELKEGDMVSVYDMSGRNIHNSQFTTSHSINVSTLSAGIYFVRIGNKTERFVKK